MGFIVPEKSGEFTPAPAGTHRAVCFRVLDLGTQPSKFGVARQFRLDFELVDELMEDGRPFTVSKVLFNPSWNPKNGWRKIADSWLSLTEAERKGFDLFSVLGRPALITIAHRPGSNGEGVYADITGVATLTKGMAKPVASNPPIKYCVDEHDSTVFAKLSERLQQKIRESVEWKAKSPGAPQAGQDFRDNIPF